MKQKLITRLYHYQCLRVTQVNYPLSHYAKPHLTQNLVVKNLVAQISDNRIHNRATDGRRTLDHVNAMPSHTITILSLIKPDQFSYQQVNTIQSSIKPHAHLNKKFNQ